MNTVNTVRIIAAIVDTRQLTLYKEDGSTITILQGDARIPSILEQSTDILLKGGVAEVNLEGTNPYKEYQEKSNGLVKFFRVAKKAVSKFFGNGEATPVEPIALGHIPETSLALEAPTPIQTAIAEVMQHAVPASAPGFESAIVGAEGDQTIIAVMEGGQIIPGIEKIKPQVKRSNDLGSSKGMDNFLKRIAAVMDRRSHSIEDLLNFMERGDLPIADDGSIVIYKVLRRHGPDAYVDCHTGKVAQKVGSYVHMDEKTVDPNRRNECSNGLHVARRAYIRGFGGDVCVIAKVRPEDVIAVPPNEADKMRVCGYHILYELPDADYQKLKSNRPFTDNDASKIALAKVLAGNHVGIAENVFIGGQYGTAVTITPVTAEPSKEVTKPAMVNVESGAAITDEEISAPPVDPKAVSKTVQETKVAMGRNAKAQKLYSDYFLTHIGNQSQAIVDELLTLKKASKVSWVKLGLPENTGELLGIGSVAKPAVIPAVPVAVGEAKAKKATAKVTNGARKPVKAKIDPTVIKMAPGLKAKLKAEARKDETHLSKQQKEALYLVRRGETKAEAARLTGINRRSIDRLIIKYGE